MSHVKGLISFAVIIPVIWIVAGCAPFATYPPVEGAVGIDYPHFEPVPSIMADALEYTHAQFGGGDRPLVFNLPDGTKPAVYKMVMHKVGDSRPMAPEDEWAYFVKAVRSRGLKAEVDLITPRADGPPALITLHMRKRLTDYEVTSMKRWNLPVELPPAFYQPEEKTASLAQTQNVSYWD